MDLVTTYTRPRSRHLSLLGRLRLALTLRRQRRRLTELDRHLLRDIGLSEDEALREAERPLWDAPGHWLR